MPLMVPRLRALHRAEDIGSALKGGVNVCQRQLVNEVLGPLVTKFVRNFGREGATPIQRGSNAAFSVASRLSNPSDIVLSDNLPTSCNKHCATLFIPHVAAYPPGRVHRAMSPNQDR